MTYSEKSCTVVTNVIYQSQHSWWNVPHTVLVIGDSVCNMHNCVSLQMYYAFEICIQYYKYVWHFSSAAHVESAE